MRLLSRKSFYETQVGVDAKATTRSRLAHAVEEMLKDRFLDGLTRLLERKFETAAQVAYSEVYEDAVVEAVTRLFEAGERRQIKDPRAYLTTIAVNYMKRVLRHAAREVLADASDEGDEEDELQDPRRAFERPTEDAAVKEIIYKIVQAQAEKLQIRNHRMAVVLALESAHEDEPLTDAELADELADLLGEEVSEERAKKWRQRGFERLLAALVEEGHTTYD
jgi:DNA-directed RNA polymerase specialized sigma24 family protein